MEQSFGFAIAIAGGALAAIFGGVGSAIGIGYAAQAANGVLSEDPEKFGSLLILVALPGTQGFYGFIGAFMVLLKIGVLGGAVVPLNLYQGLQIFFAAMPVAIAGLISAIWQGKVCTAGVEMVAKRPTEAAKAMIYGILVEMYAVLGLIVSIIAIILMKL
ncbi:MAG: V-type ATP synthase subunit K [candidate division WOR-3 bacterium]|nr:MAG: V-type ATP synthase subunit K [candidate division WOR-3 bacterium]